MSRDSKLFGRKTKKPLHKRHRNRIADHRSTIKSLAGIDLQSDGLGTSCPDHVCKEDSGTILISVAAVIFSLYVSLWAVIVSLWASCAALAICPIVFLAYGIAIIIGGNTLGGLFIIGCASASGGLAIFFYLGCSALTKCTVRLTKWMFTRFKRKN